MNALRLFRRGPGRRRLPDAHRAALARITELEAQLAQLAGLVRYPCPLLGHPAQWSTAPAGDCPWCVAETYADEAADLREEVWPYRAAAANAAAVDVAALADVEGSCFAEPTTVVPETELRIVDIPPGPVGGEAASVSEETQAVDMRVLRERMGLGDTTKIPVIPGAEDDTRPIATVRQLAELATTPWPAGC